MKRIKLLSVLSVLVLTFASTSCSKVPAGNVGIKFYLLGGDKGVDHETLSPGRYWIGWNEELYKFPTFTQNETWTSEDDGDGDESITFQTSNGLSVNSDVGITYHLESSKIPVIFETYKRGIDEITDVFIRNMVRDAFVQVASSKDVEYIYGKGKSELIDQVEKLVKSQTDTIGIIVDKIYVIGEMRLPQSVRDAIDSKIKATQEAQRRENEVRKTIAEGRKRVEEARADSLSAVISAAGEAQANRILNNSLTPTLIRYQTMINYFDKWNGVEPKVKSDGSGMILDIGKQ